MCPLIVELTDGRTIKESLARVSPRRSPIIVDMSQVKSIDSAGLGAMLRLLHHVQAARGTLLVCGLSKPVRVVFELTRLHRAFDIYPEVDDALLAVEGIEEEFVSAM
jgi:anti-anti-sigma factor